MHSREGTIADTIIGQGSAAPPGSKSVACHQSRPVNVGDPDRSFRDEGIDRQAEWRGSRKGGQEVRGGIVVRGGESLPHGEGPRVESSSEGTRCASTEAQLQRSRIRRG